MALNLEQTYFSKVRAGGMTMSIWIATGLPSKQEAQNEWEKALDTAIKFFKQQGIPANSHYTPIY